MDINSPNPVAPYTSWDTAAVDIQDAVNVATPGSVVMVTNGPTFASFLTDYITNSAAFYVSGGATAPDGNFYRVVITNDITVESVNGPATTYIWGPTPNQPYPYGNPNADAVYLANGATLSGFTITNYSQSPSVGQITATSTNAFITNCIITHYANVNSGTLGNCTVALYSAANNSVLNNCSLVSYSSSFNSTLNGCIISNNGAVYGGVLNNCTLVDNTNSNSGQGGVATAALGYSLVLNNCILSNNVTQNGGGGYGGGVLNTFQGVPAYYTNCVLNNCTLAQNYAQYEGGAAYGAELNNCLISGNNARSGGSGVEGGLLNNCTLIGNSNSAADGTYLAGTVLSNCVLIANGPGAMKCTLDQCTLIANIGVLGGGANNSVLNDCLIVSNMATRAAEGGGAYDCSLTNCVVADNTASYGGGAYQSTLVNCTVVGNKALGSGGGLYNSAAQDCIIYYNTNGDFYSDLSQPPLMSYCCASIRTTSGITNAPLFVNVADGDYHLQPNSPCINSGNNAFIATTSSDLDGNPRIVGGTVDIGAYEYQTPTSFISYAYLQQYGLPIDGSVDFADLDGTAFNVYQDWVAGLNPTNPASVLAMLKPNAVNNVAGITVSWQSVSGILYNLQRSTNLTAQPAFTTVQPNITGQAGATSFTDTSATNGVPYFYRVNVVAP